MTIFSEHFVVAYNGGGHPTYDTASEFLAAQGAIKLFKAIDFEAWTWKDNYGRDDIYVGLVQNGRMRYYDIDDLRSMISPEDAHYFAHAEDKLETNRLVEEWAARDYANQSSRVNSLG